MASKRTRNEKAENEQEKSLQIAADLGHCVTLLEDAFYDSTDDEAAPTKKVPSFINTSDRCEVNFIK